MERFVVLLKHFKMKKLLVIAFLIFIGLNSTKAQWNIDTTNVSNGFTGINFVSNQIGYGTHASKIYKTTNGGKNWQTIKNSTISYLEDVVATSIDSAFAFGTYGYIYYTYNSGQNWDSLHFDSTSSFITAHVFDHDSLWFIGYRYDYTIIYKTGDGCQTFTQDTIQGIIGSQDIEVNRKGKIFIAGQKVNFLDRSIFYSDDQGLTWNPLNAVNANQVLDIETIDNTIMHTGSFGNMYTSIDSGITFFNRSVSQNAAYVKIISDSLAFGFHGGSNYPKIFKSTNVGDTWQNINIPFTGNISDADQPYINYPELFYLSVASYPYFYRYCDDVSLKLNSSLGYVITCGDTTQLTVNKYFKNYWSTGDSTQKIKITNPGNYWVVGENICGNKDTINFQIAQIPIPVKVSNDTTICEGDSIQLISFGGNTHAWAPSFGLSSISDSAVSAQPDTSISYTILISDSATQCFKGDTISITVIPKVEIGLDSIKICYRDTVIIEADSIQGYIYDWGFGTFYNLFRVGFLADTSIQLDLSVTSQSGVCIFLDSIQIEVVQRPFSPNKTFDVCIGDTISDTLMGVLQNISPFQKISFSPGNNLVKYFPDSNTTFILSMQNPLFGCQYFDTTTIKIDTIQSLVNGTALSSSGSNLQGGLAYMINYNPIDSTVIAVDISSISSIGSFTLQSNLSNYFIKVVPDATLHPFQIPTYFQNGAIFQSADSLVEQCAPRNIQVSTIQGLNTGGLGFIAGNIYKGAGKSKPLSFDNLSLLLTDTNFQPLRYTETDTLGYFEFSDLPFGSYHITGDHLSLNNQSPNKIVLNNAQPKLNGVFNSIDGSILISYVLSIGKLNFNEFVSIFPNPTNGKVWILSKPQIKSVEVFNQFGQQIEFSKITNEHHFSIDLSNFSNGIYLIKVNTLNSVKSLKILKN